MALHPNFPNDPHAILDPGIRWFRRMKPIGINAPIN